MRRRCGREAGTTLIELSLVMVLTAVVIGALAGLFCFASARAAHAYANTNSIGQARGLLDQMQAVVTNAESCTLVVGAFNTGLKCTMPANGSDKDGDGYLDVFSPNAVSRRGFLKWGTGMRVWFYTADATGDFIKAGSMQWRAKRTDDSIPTSSDADSAWATYYGSGQKYSLITGVTFVVDATGHTVTATVTANDLTRREAGSTSTSDSNVSYTATLSRKIYWRNWRQ